MPKAASVIDEIASLIPERVGVRPWWERVSPDVASALPGVLEAWQSGQFGAQRRTAARAIAAWLNKRGVEIGVQGVEAWLRRSGR